ncbi:MAG TPA: ribonuclease PH [bacterium]|nr:ribonuclease PH [bacterium]
MRHDGRKPTQMRLVKLTKSINRYAEGSCLVEFGNTRVHCTASVENQIPRWRDAAEGGWVTGEYDMLPRANRERGNRSGGRGGRAQEISRLIGRSLRAVTDLKLMPGLTVSIDCDVLQADGGTRTAAITGGFVALADALTWCKDKKMIKRIPLLDTIAAISVGIVDDEILLDLDYQEDKQASVDANFVITGEGRLVEVQATGEEATFTTEQLGELLAMAQTGVRKLTKIQRHELGRLHLLGTPS